MFAAGTDYQVIELKAGEDFVVTVTVKDNNIPVDLTYVRNAVFTARRSFYYPGDVHTFNVEKMTPYNQGNFKISYSASQTLTMKSGRYVFDFILETPTTFDGSTGEPTSYTTIKVITGILIVYPTASIAGYYPF